ncbi:winged helix-turn-helix transcriptional regulator [Deinococcus roseus]|uniref:HxlR family transcriptional regulator n=1 Tax=Deinococcus roseus TaxID=392414 RepID=A0ABQ2D299_9DEIO|nr:helix-turn-helix domain-containing protein [Deinococcus roseus]GGJ40938.1 HxlR family transcriptional regulator [Deinococcus roseus]
MNTPEHYCPTGFTLKVIGGRWKVPILYLLFHRPHRFAEMRRAIGAVTEKMLTQQLRELEEDGIVQRKIYDQIPPKVEYSLTPFGETLHPVIQAIGKWSMEHGPAATNMQQEPAGCGPAEVKPQTLQ